MKYNVLRPVYDRTGDPLPFVSRNGNQTGVAEWQRSSWRCVGQALDMADAKRKFGGAPVLESIRG